MIDINTMAKSRNYFVKEFLLYLTVQKNLSPGTIKAYEHDLKKFFDFLSPYLEQELTLQEIDEKTVMEFLSVLKLEKNYSARSMNRKISSLKTYFKYLEKEGYIPYSPLGKIDSMKLPVRLPKAFEINEVQVLLNTLEKEPEKSQNAIYRKKRDRAIIELFYATGMRISELVNLNLSQINFDSGTVRVIGKGNKERIVFINDTALDLLKEYIPLRPEGEEALFISQKGGRLTVRAIQHMFERYIKKSGLRSSSPHAMRHSFATHMMEGGADLVTIKELLGHANLSTTQIYLKVSPKRMEKVYKSAHPRAKKELCEEDSI